MREVELIILLVGIASALLSLHINGKRHPRTIVCLVQSASDSPFLACVEFTSIDGTQPTPTMAQVVTFETVNRCPRADLHLVVSKGIITQPGIRGETIASIRQLMLAEGLRRALSPLSQENLLPPDQRTFVEHLLQSLPEQKTH